jgi:hypothetical protein
MRGFVTAVPSVNDALLDRGALLRLLDAAREDVERLEAALKVLADAAEQFGDWDDDDKKLFVALRLKDLRRARASLSKDAAT